ncbi:SPW repeat protein [Streptomyces purpureus]|uniref:Membrane protein n=1 Tax=Streptomyces purpureus TaxID=1951 RepID=A0A918H1I9_9ACTN|nr:SPW repeat protein [Streptomyces purpureus]GGT30363.1 membrane protein [Streptomyces purpureus]
MADVSHRPGDIAGHPDASEMRERYAKMLGTRGVAAVEELVLLAGIYAAISAWTVHFAAAKPELALSNLICGIAIAVLGLAMSMAPERSQDLNFVVLLLGVWLIISPWVVSRDAGTGAILSNVITGACVCLFALVAGGLLMSKGRSGRRTT